MLSSAAGEPAGARALVVSLPAYICIAETNEKRTFSFYFVVVVRQGLST